MEKTAGKAEIYLDTAYCANPWLDRSLFRDIIRKHGASKILFGSDYPWHLPSKEIELIRSLDISEEEKSLILGENALLFVDVVGLGAVLWHDNIKKLLIICAICVKGGAISAYNQQTPDHSSAINLKGCVLFIRCLIEAALQGLALVLSYFAVRAALSITHRYSDIGENSFPQPGQPNCAKNHE